MAWRGEVEDGVGHEGLAPPSKAQQKREVAIQADRALAHEIARLLETGRYSHAMNTNTAALLRRMAGWMNDLL